MKVKSSPLIEGKKKITPFTIPKSDLDKMWHETVMCNIVSDIDGLGRGLGALAELDYNFKSEAWEFTENQIRSHASRKNENPRVHAKLINSMKKAGIEVGDYVREFEQEFNKQLNETARNMGDWRRFLPLAVELVHMGLDISPTVSRYKKELTEHMKGLKIKSLNHQFRCGAWMTKLGFDVKKYAGEEFKEYSGLVDVGFDENAKTMAEDICNLKTIGFYVGDLVKKNRGRIIKAYENETNMIRASEMAAYMKIIGLFDTCGGGQNTLPPIKDL